MATPTPLKVPKPIPASRYEHANDNYEGYCTVCREFTCEQVEPDAINRRCPSCDNASVMGAEEAVLMGEIEVTF